MKTSAAGDTIQLAPGNYAATITGLALGGVTITSADASRPATITSLNVTGSSGLVFSDLEFRADAAGGDNAFRVSSSKDVTFQRLDVHGSMDGDPQNDVAAFLLRTSSDIVVKDSEFQQLSRAVSHLDVTGLTVSGNSFHDLRSDGVLGGGSSFVTITNNRFTDFYPVKGDHADAVQFWTSNTTTNAHDIRVAGNVVTRGDGEVMQGVFMGNEADGVFYERVVIENNVISGGMYHGINVASAFDVTVRDNVVQGFSDMKSWIRLNEVDGATVSNNSTNIIILTETSKNVVQAGNSIVGLAGDLGAWAVSAWRGQQGQGLLGSPIEGGVGAERLTGSSAADRILGGADNDTIVDVAGANYLRGDDGDDVVRGGFDFDDINGNAGADTLFGGGGADWVVGGRDNDSLSGDAGADLVYGNAGADTLSGGDGADTLRGGQDNDLIIGGAGNDFLAGDKGTDTLTGGAGADTFFASADSGVDVITYFNAAEGDRVQLAQGSSWTIDQIGADVVVSIAGGGQVVLAGVSLANLPSGWIFV